MALYSEELNSMKTIIFFWIGIIFFLYSSTSSAEVVEILKPELSGAYFEAAKLREQSIKHDPDKVIESISSVISKSSNPIEKFNLIFWELSFLYAENEKYDRCLQILEQGQDEGLFYPLQTGNSIWPKYLNQLKDLDRFNSFIEENNLLKQKAQENANFEYFVQLPQDYKSGTSYPLLIVLHGGFGSHYGSSEKWHSAKLDSQYIVAYLQGVQYRGSFLRSFMSSDFTNIVEAYDQIKQKYKVDTSRVILGGVSAGGMRSITIALNELIPTAGLLLAFPVKPEELEDHKLQTAAETGLRAAVLCGENDWAIKQQKELGVIFDKNNIPNRFVVFSGKGHEYPDNFSGELDISIDFISKVE